MRSADELEKMHRAGLVVHEVLQALRKFVRPGMTTMDLEEEARRLIAGKPGKPAFKGYRGYPCVLCTSVNSEIVHGIPSPKRKLKEGDIVSIDFGMEVDGMEVAPSQKLHIEQSPTWLSFLNLRVLVDGF